MNRWRRTPHRVWLLSLVAWVIVCAQMLGVVHAVHHLPGVAHATEPASDHDGFGHGAGGQDCRVFDQLTLGSLAIGVSQVVLPTTAADVIAVEPPRSHVGERAWRAPARGPPTIA